MLSPSSLASSQSWRTTSGLQKLGPRVASAIVIRPSFGVEVLLPDAAGIGAVEVSTLPA